MDSDFCTAKYLIEMLRARLYYLPWPHARVLKSPSRQESLEIFRDFTATRSFKTRS
jgi:hypothetical protein